MYVREGGTKGKKKGMIVVSSFFSFKFIKQT